MILVLFHMFILDYIIIDNDDYLRNISQEQIQKEGVHIYGLLNFNCDGLQVGSYYDGYKDNPFESGIDILGHWVESLVIASRHLQMYEFIAIRSLLGDDYFWTFEKKGDYIYLNKSKPIKSVTELILFKKKDLHEFKLDGVYRIEKDIFDFKVKESTAKFINELINLNPVFSEVRYVRDLKSSFENNEETC